MLKTSAGALVLPGDFAAVRLHGDTGKLIRLGEELNGDGFGDWEHAIFYAGEKNDLILEAEPGGARLVPFHYEAADVLWSSDSPALDLTEAQRAMARRVAGKYRGTPYSFLDYAALAAHRLHIWAPGLKHFVGTSKHMICSQLADQCRLDMGSHLFSDGRWPGYVTPLDLANLINQKG
jgi:hypothetical protein